MSQFDKYIKIAQEMIFEGAKKGDLYLKEDGNMHGGSIIVSDKGNKNTKIKEIILIKKVDINNLYADLSNLAKITEKSGKLEVTYHNKEDVCEFKTTEDYSSESGEGFYLNIKNKSSKGPFYLNEDGNLHGGSIIISDKGHKNTKIKEIIFTKKLNLSNLQTDLNNLATVTKKGDKFEVHLKNDDVIEFTTVNDYTTESGEGFYLKIS